MRFRHPSILAPFAAVAIFATVSAAIWADDATHKSAANALFEEGKRLSAEGRVGEACQKFSASFDLLPRLGVQLNLADCYERLGKTASAWVTFGDAAAIARRTGDMREDFARRRAAALVPRLTKLLIAVPPASAAVEALEVRHGGQVVAKSLYGVEVPVDPGEHDIEAAAPRHTSWRMRVRAAREGAVMTVSVPVLSKMAEPVVSPGASSQLAVVVPEPEGRRRPPFVSWLAGGIGIVATGVGAYCGVAAWSRWQHAKSGCDGAHGCADSSYDETLRARRYGNVSTIAFGIGGVGLATAALFYLTAPRDRAVRLTPMTTGRSFGLGMEGTF